MSSSHSHFFLLCSIIASACRDFFFSTIEIPALKVWYRLFYDVDWNEIQKGPLWEKPTPSSRCVANQPVIISLAVIMLPPPPYFAKARRDP